MAKPPYLLLDDLRGGISDADAPFSIQDNEVVTALNVDYREGHIGSKRSGCAPVSLTGSVFVRDVPVMGQRDSGGWNNAASGTVAVTANGAVATNHILIVHVCCTNDTATGSRTVSAMDLGGTALTLLNRQTAFNFTREVWYLRNPSIAGGTLNVTLSGSGDAAVIAERWTNVDSAASPLAGTATTDADTRVRPNGTVFDPTYMVLSTVAWISAATLTLQTSAVWSSAQTTGGSAKIASAAQIGMKPTTQFLHTFSISAAMIISTIGVLGVTLSTGRPLRSIMRFSPTNDATGDELWAQDSAGRLDRRVSGVWQNGVPAVNYLTGSFLAGGYGTNATSLHGKFFLALDGTTYIDRTHIWDGTTLRPAGFTTPTTAPGVSDSGGVGTYVSTRYFRFRLIERSGSTILRRSEPSPVATFAPSGINTSAALNFETIYSSNAMSSTFPISWEAPTHAEWEASMDNVLFYRIATVAVVAGSAATTDATSAAVGYSLAGTLSDALTEYTPLSAARHVTVDEDRLLIGGSPFTAVNDSRVSWTVLTADTGVGNDERVPATTRHFLDLDGLSGGRLTHMMPAVMGGIIAGKLSRIYKLIRTGNPNKAYDSQQLTPNRGMLPRAAHDGTDENGMPCVYFVDPNVGACRYGIKGIEDLMQKRRTISARINKAATVAARVLFYPKHWLVWFALAENSTLPNYICCYNVRQESWTDYNGHMATMISAILFPDSTTQELRPLLVPNTLGTTGIVEADNGTNDDGTYFRGYFVSKAYVVGLLFSEFEIDGGALHAKAGSATVGVTIIRDLGVESKNAEPVSLVASEEGETYVTRLMDDLAMAELEQVQFEFGDPSNYTGIQLAQTWTLESLAAKYGAGTEG